MTLASKITVTRIALIPFIIFLLYTSYIPYSKTVAVLLFIIAAATDAVDGYVARKYKQITALGKFLDPLADKLLLVTMFVCLVDQEIISAIPVIIIIAREFSVTGLRLIAAADGNVIAASKLGKYKTVTQIISVVMLYLGLDPHLFFLWITVFITVWSGFDYFAKNKQVF